MLEKYKGETVTCKCGHWYNTNTKCPDCETKASKIYCYNYKVMDDSVKEE